MSLAAKKRWAEKEESKVKKQIHVGSIRDMIKRRAIPYLMNGRQYLIDRLDWGKWIERRKIKAVDE
jgi:hypothetical protein